MMIEQHIEEGLSRAYVLAVAARAGVNVGLPQHDYGVDGTFSRILFNEGRWAEDGVKLDYQLKASTRWEMAGEELVYDLEAKTYNDLIARSRRQSAVPL